MDNKQRFSNRVDTYVKYRPSYPVEALDYLYETVGLQKDSVIADIGAGTGMFTKLLLERGSKVLAVEPNEAMRREVVRAFKSNAHFVAVDGSAEQTGLPDASVDHIVCAQAFHWFDQERAKIEFKRILKPGGTAALIWNSRKTKGTAFLERYEQLLQTYGTDYNKVKHTNIDAEQLRGFFPSSMHIAEFSNTQLVDFEGLSGRLLSSSYSPLPGHSQYEPMMKQLRSIFDQTNQDGKVVIDYMTQIFWGEL